MVPAGCSLYNLYSFTASWHKGRSTPVGCWSISVVAYNLCLLLGRMWKATKNFNQMGQSCRAEIRTQEVPKGRLVLFGGIIWPENCHAPRVVKILKLLYYICAQHIQPVNINAAVKYRWTGAQRRKQRDKLHVRETLCMKGCTPFKVNSRQYSYNKK
jgi:hypothetical protein